ncbi:unnamed protein product, partial [marine sediment metagenome]
FFLFTIFAFIILNNIHITRVGTLDLLKIIEVF